MSGYNGFFQNLMPDLYSPVRNNENNQNQSFSRDWSTPERRESDSRYTLYNRSDFNRNNTDRNAHNSSTFNTTAYNNYGANASTGSISNTSNDDSFSGYSGRSSWLQDDSSDGKTGSRKSLPFTRYRPPCEESKKKDRLNTHFRI